AEAPVDPDSVWLYHKTTRRETYAAARAARPDCDEVLLWNTRGELTEATTANLVLRLDGRLLTPPITAGLLPGTFRAHLLHTGQIHEHRLTPADLPRAAAIWLVNSVRRWRRAVLIPEKERKARKGTQSTQSF
ncbi:MAG: aminotransferase class IV, partial [Anaerolineales bacterium]|nr:aminotransferase class IV [Anaerolineales bacterium]